MVSIDDVLKLYSELSVYRRLYIKLKIKRRPLHFMNEMLPSNGLLIDVGCGYGILSNYIALNSPNCKVIGVDLNPGRIKNAIKTIKSRDNIEFLLRDVTEWDMPPCDCVIMTAFLHHVSPHKQGIILENVYNGLKSGGRLIITEVDTESRAAYKYWKALLMERLLYPFSKISFRKANEWKHILSNIGFDVQIIREKNPKYARIFLICCK